jgi:methylenetetrahydrofolate reductase (NADPH)
LAGVKFIRDIHAARRGSRPVISFEFFPPKTEEGDRILFEKTLPALIQLKPDYCSVTYGAGGSTRDKTLTIVDRIQREYELTAMSHLTCVNATREEIRQVIEQARALGIKNILALRGDPPGGTGEFAPVPGGFEFSYQLVRFLRELGGFSIGTAGFPEGHIA